MTVITFTRTVRAPIEDVWQWLTDPARMNAWSVAPVEMAAGEDPWRPGAVRIVRVRRFGVPLRLDEYVVSTMPPHEYRYRVRPNAVVRRHDAVQQLTEADGATRVTWRVDIRGWIPGLMSLLVRSMRVQLEQSLDQLVRVVESEAGSARAT
jgi:uncharacterized protein YndB with AHSA1/START domain